MLANKVGKQSFSFVVCQVTDKIGFKDIDSATLGVHIDDSMLN